MFIIDTDQCYPKYEHHHVEDDHLEICRLNVDTKHRQTGIATALVNNIEKVGLSQEVQKIKVETSSGQEAAMAFYHRNNWTEVSKYYLR